MELLHPACAPRPTQLQPPWETPTQAHKKNLALEWKMRKDHGKKLQPHLDEEKGKIWRKNRDGHSYDHAVVQPSPLSRKESELIPS